MKHRWLGFVGQVLLGGTALPSLLFAQAGGQTDAQIAAQTEPGQYARIALLRPHDGDTVDFEAGYIRHLEWHRQVNDSWAWYAWNISFGERQRWFVYATFGHSAASFDNVVNPAEDERDNISNVTPHGQYLGSGIYEYLPQLSRGSTTGEPRPKARLEFTTVDLQPGAERAFEAALSEVTSTLEGQTLWYRMVVGGPVPRYVRLRPRPSLAAILDARSGQALPDKVDHLIAKTTVEILTLRPTMSYGLSPLAGDGEVDRGRPAGDGSNGRRP